METGKTPSGEEASNRLSVLIISDQLVTTLPLPSSGEVRIGRAQTADMVVDDPSISRSHALLTIGSPITIKDLGSANGTRVRDRNLREDETVEIAPGDVILLGNATLIVQRRAPPVKAQRLWAHDYFEVRLEEECARCLRDNRTFAVARIHYDPPPSNAQLQQVLAAEARSADVLGTYGPKELELILVETGPDEAILAVERVANSLRKRGSIVQTGLATFPSDGRNAHELIHRASPFPRDRQPSDHAEVSAAVVADRRMQDLYRLAERIAAGNIAVLILGETGVGKEVLAERVHRMSPRSSKPYLKLNCAALSETLLESELFGHERGAFTGAVSSKQGLLETANGGTVFLDEVGELPHATQVKLLRVLEERVVQRVGGLKPIPLDVRFIAATNRDLETEIVRGTFRQDLYFRLNGATLVIPPLRERASEIPDLARAFISQAARNMGLGSQPALSREALAMMVSYSWPGNIRELRNVAERAVLLCGDGPIESSHLPLEKMRSTISVQAVPPSQRPPVRLSELVSSGSGPIRAPDPTPPMMGRTNGPTLPDPYAMSQPARARFGQRSGFHSDYVGGDDDPSGDDLPARRSREVGDSTMPLVIGPLDTARAVPHSVAAGHQSERSGTHRIPIQPRIDPEEEEKARILDALAECNGNQTAAAKQLGIARRTLINKLERYGISGPRKKR